MHPIVIIPARLAASRLPGKPLLDIGGQPMILRVMRQALAAGVGPVAVAAGDLEIAWAVESAGGRAVMTDPDMPSGSDRIRAALAELDPEGRHDVVINLQGDIPFVDPALVQACAGVLEAEPSCDIATLIAPEGSPAERTDPDCPKAIVTLLEGSNLGPCHYFTRSTLYGDGPVWRHIGIYGYRRHALEQFTAARPSPLEQREKLEQLRALELGLSIWAAAVPAMPMEVNNAAELAAARAYAEQN
ncbi:MAG: 3-deoxy-manno-octulosonate cytidylyltransferase [Caulobacteraceae bacterium]|nr:3-deoxy-manno-octulosonate cytidylyltransferase [Caulobacteraceae bacterium]